jgi:FKBP-type peptidyl-prolyl cis-trans isomerase 2
MLSRLSGSRDAKAGMAAIIIVAVLIISSVGVFLFVTDSGAKQLVEKGSKISVNYYGQYWDGEKYVVFDTSIFNVADNNVTYPKSMFFNYIANATNYKPLSFTVGGGTMITGFDTGVRGMGLGDTKVIVVKPGDGYKVDATKLKTILLNQTKYLTQTLTKADFKTYFGEDPVNLKPYKDPIYGWDVDVLFDGTNAYITNRVNQAGADYKVYASSTDSSYGWYANVTVEGSTIRIHHLLNSTSALNVKGMDSSRAKLFVDSVDLANGTAVLSWNKEVAGRELTFTVTVLTIQ